MCDTKVFLGEFLLRTSSSEQLLWMCSCVTKVHLLMKFAVGWSQLYTTTKNSKTNQLYGYGPSMFVVLFFKCSVQLSVLVKKSWKSTCHTVNS